jgi:N-acylneuraminate cytidylyltransferase
MRVVALVCARGGSKGLPRKNLLRLAGEPLIVRTIRQVLSMSGIDRLIVSTDAEEIADVARNAGADVPYLRPAELAQDDSPEWLVWRHALQYLKDSGDGYPDALLVVPTTAPLRSIGDLQSCLDEFEKNDVDIVITVTDAHRNPYFNMVKVDADGTVAPVVRLSSSFFRRQDAPLVYDMTTVAYVARPEFVMTRNGIFEGRVRHVHVPAERAVDIDSELDLQIAEILAAPR